MVKISHILIGSSIVAAFDIAYEIGYQFGGFPDIPTITIPGTLQLPNVDDWLIDLGIPLLLFLITGMSDLTIGALAFGIPMFIYNTWRITAEEIKTPSPTLSVPNSNNPTLTQQVSTGGQTLTSYPRTSFVLGNSGSVKEIASLPENGARSEAILPTWRNWEGTFGSIPPNGATGSFNGKSSGLTIPEEVHVTPELESQLAAISDHRTWQTGGLQPTGTFI